MTEERITETETPNGNTHTHTTVITDERPSGGAGKWVLLLVILVVAVLGFVVFSQMSDAEIAKDNAIGDAAESVGNAAENVGEAAQDVTDAVTE